MEFFEPRINADTAEFWAGCKAHELRFARCKQCGTVRWPGGYLCPACLSSEAETAVLPKEGTLYSYVIMDRPFHPSVADKVPYVVATVDLSEGVRILANILEYTPEKLRCGAKVTIDFADAETYSRPIAKLKGENQ